MKNPSYNNLSSWNKSQYDSYEEHQKNCDFMELVIEENKPHLKAV